MEISVDKALLNAHTGMHTHCEGGKPVCNELISDIELI